ncbi:MAG: hypothetical protein QM811_00825 [Pirellulales bacterium]
MRIGAEFGQLLALDRDQRPRRIGQPRAADIQRKLDRLTHEQAEMPVDRDLATRFGRRGRDADGEFGRLVRDGICRCGWQRLGQDDFVHHRFHGGFVVRRADAQIIGAGQIGGDADALAAQDHAVIRRAAGDCQIESFVN